jgi:dienelactone hydrolase
MKVEDKRKRTISLAVLCVPLMLTWVSMGLCSDDLRDSEADARLPVTTIHFSRKTSIIAITSWRICGPFVVDDRDQRYSLSSEAEMFEKDYLEAARAREAPLKLPSGITNVEINFQRDPVHEPRVVTSTGVFLNQNQVFPTPEVDSQLLYWSGYHVFKVMYAVAELASSTEQDVVLLAATSSPIKIWINDTVQTQSAPGSVGAEWDTHVGVKVHLRAGRNTVLVKLICFPLRNDFGVWFATLDRARQFIEEHGGVADVLTQIIASRGAPLRLTPVIDLYGGSPGGEGRYDIRDAAGRIVATSELATADTEVDTSALPEGLYSINLEKGALVNGELFFVGDIKHRLAMFSSQCASKAVEDLPCEALPKLTELSESSGASFRLEKEKFIIFLLAQFEWSLRGISPQMVFPDNALRIRLMSFRSNLDGSTQLYYLHLPPDVQSGHPLPLVVVEPFNDKPAPFFDSAPTTTYLALQRYARFADQYHLSFIAPFGRGKLMPSALAERDVLEAIQDAKERFRVDDSRIYLTGECVAGRSAFLMAEDYPEIFSAVSTLSAATGEISAVTNPEWNSANPLLRLRNLSSISIRLIHGDADFHSPSPQASLFMQEAGKVGVSPEMVWLPGNSKFGLIEPQRAMFGFFATVKTREPAIPRHITLAVTEPEHNHAFWIQVDQLGTTDTPGYVTGHINARNRINITSTNIRRVTINTLRLPPSRAGRRPWVIVCNGGQKQRGVPDQSEQIVLNISQGGDSIQ